MDLSPEIASGCRSGPITPELVRELAVLRAASEEQLRVLAGVGRWDLYAQGESIVRPGSGLEFVFIVVDGVVRVYGDPGAGHSATLFFLAHADILDAGRLPDPLGDVLYAEAFSRQVLLYRFPWQVFHTATLAHPQTAWAVLTQARRREQQAACRLIDCTCRDTTTRTAHILAEVHRAIPAQLAGMSQERLAEIVGISVTATKRAVRTLEHRHLVQHTAGKRGVEVLDDETLATL